MLIENWMKKLNKWEDHSNWQKSKEQENESYIMFIYHLVKKDKRTIQEYYRFPFFEEAKKLLPNGWSITNYNDCRLTVNLKEISQTLSFTVTAPESGIRFRYSIKRGRKAFNIGVETFDKQWSPKKIIEQKEEEAIS